MGEGDGGLINGRNVMKKGQEAPWKLFTYFLAHLNRFPFFCCCYSPFFFFFFFLVACFNLLSKIFFICLRTYL
jgi:hypothetical protein